MSTPDIIRSIIEIIVIGFVMWGLFHEDICAEYEQKLFSKIKNIAKAGWEKIR